MAEPRPPETQGSTWRLKQIGLAKLLHNLAISQMSGTLILKRGEVAKSIFFKSGYVMFAESNLATDRLGEVLCRRGEITRAQLSECLAEAKRSGKMLGAVLVEKQVLRAERLLPAIEVQVREIVLGAFAWDDGDYVLSKEIVGSTEQMLDLKIRTSDLIMEGVRRTYSAAQASRIIGNTQLPPRLGADSNFLSQDLTVNFEISKVLSKIDGRRSIAQIVTETGLTELAVLQILAALGHLRILSVDGAGDAPAAPAPSPAAPAVPREDLRVKAARVEEMRAHDEVTQLLDRLPPLVSQLALDPRAATPDKLAAAGPGADAIAQSFGAGRRILDVLQERNYTLELVRAVSNLFAAGILKQVTAAPATTPAASWTPAAPAAPAAGSNAQTGGGSWAVPRSSSVPVGGALPGGGGMPQPPPVSPPPWGAPRSAPPSPSSPPPTPPAPPAAGFPAMKADPPPATRAPVQDDLPAAKGPNGAWAPPPVAPPAPPSAPTSGGSWGAPVAAPTPVAAPVSPATPPVAAPVPTQGWGAPTVAPRPVQAPPPLPPVVPPPPPPATIPGASSPGAWGAPTPPPPTPAGRPTGPAVWSVPAATPAAADPFPEFPAVPSASPGVSPSPPPWRAGTAPPPLEPIPAPLPISPLPPPPKDTRESQKAREKENTATQRAVPKAGGSRRGIMLGVLLLLGLGGAAGAHFAGLIVIPGLPVPGATPVAAVTPSTVASAATAIAMVSPPVTETSPVATVSVEASPIATASVVATVTQTATPTATATATPTATATATPTATPARPSPTPTKVAIVSTPKPTPKPDDGKKRAAALASQAGEELKKTEGADYTKALHLAQQAAKASPEYPDSYFWIATAYIAMNDFPSAKKALTQYFSLATESNSHWSDASQLKTVLGS